jgi:hypothetical protein
MVYDVQYEMPKSQYEYVVSHPQAFHDLKKGAFFCMDQVHGWCSYQKASILMDLMLKAKPKVIVEIGVWGGKSLLPMAFTLKGFGFGKIYGIDPWENEASLEGVVHESNIAYWGNIDHQLVLDCLIQTIDSYDLYDYVELIRSTSAKAPLIENIDILHVDGNHSEVTSYLDVTKWLPMVKKGGWIVVDDMTWFENGMTTTGKAVEYLDKHCHKIAEIEDNCVWGIWVKL